MADKQMFSPLLKADEGGKFVTAAVLIPEPYVDLQGDVCSESDIAEAAADYLQRSRKGGLQHEFVRQDIVLTESWVTKSEGVIGTTRLPRGSWCVTFRLDSPEVRKMVTSGQLTGLSISGDGIREPWEG